MKQFTDWLFMSVCVNETHHCFLSRRTIFTKMYFTWFRLLLLFCRTVFHKQMLIIQFPWRWNISAKSSSQQTSKQWKWSTASSTAQKMKFPIKDFFSKCDQIRSFPRIWSYLLKKSLMENFIFCAVFRPNWRYKILLDWNNLCLLALLRFCVTE